MAHGFRVIGDSGSVQVDESYTNLALVQSGTLFVPVGLDGASITVHNLQTPIMCVQTTGGAKVVVTSNQAIPSTTYKFMASASGNVKWFVFDQGAQISSGFGITVFKDDGSIAYNSDWRVMRIGAVAPVANATDPYLPLSSVVATAPRAGDWAACLTSSRAFVDSGGGSQISRLHVDGLSTGQNFARIDDMQIGSIPWGAEPPSIIQPLGGSIILVDVSGY